MRYKIHNAISIKDKNKRNRAKSLIKRQLSRIERVTEGYPKNLQVEFYLNHSDKLNYSVSAMIKLKEGVVFVKERGESVEAIIFSLFDKLKLHLARRINKERKSYLKRRRESRITEFKAYLPELKESINEDTRGLSNQLMGIILQDISRYVERRIRSAEMTSAIRKGKFKIQEILDDIYLLAFNDIPDLPEKALHNNAWIYHITDDYLADLFQEIKFEKENVKSLEDFVEAEYELNQARYVYDAEQKIIPMEELDGYDEISDRYMADDLFIGETENSLLDEITLKLNQDEINIVLQKEIAKLPMEKRTLIELYLIDQMNLEEISSIKKISVPEAEAVIREVGNFLKRKLSEQL